MKQYVCIDIGGTEIKYGVLDENELFLTKDKMPTEAFKGGPSLLEKAVGIVREYLKLYNDTASDPGPHCKTQSGPASCRCPRYGL